MDVASHHTFSLHLIFRLLFLLSEKFTPNNIHFDPVTQWRRWKDVRSVCKLWRKIADKTYEIPPRLSIIFEAVSKNNLRALEFILNTFISI